MKRWKSKIDFLYFPSHEVHRYVVCLVLSMYWQSVQFVISPAFADCIGDTSLIVVGKRARKLFELGDWWVKG